MRLKRICLLAGIFLLAILSTEQLKGQSPLTDIRFTWVDVNNSANDYTATSSPSSGGNIDDNVSYDIFFSRNTTTENNRRVSGYTLGGVDYDFLLDPDTLALRRLGSASRLSLWIEADGAVDNTADEIYLAPERQVPERSLYQANLLNIGYDNVLLNSGTNASNIERIDAIYRTGMATSTPANAVIPVMDRGANGEFKIAMILSLDANGDPASYGNLVTVNTSDFGSGVVDLGLSILFLQQALGEDPIPTGTSTQALGGTGITFTELGIAANEIVYGYSLFGIDVNTTDHDLTDISTFPTDSNNSGLDMAAGAVSAVSSDGNLVKTTGPGGYKAALNTWLKANAGVTTATDASTVTDWQDQSLGDHDATTLINAPTYRDGSASAAEAINFNPTVDFIDASETGLQIANNSDFNVGGQPYTTKSFNVAIRTGNNVTTKQQLYEQGDDDRGIDMYIESGNLVVTAYNGIDDSGSGVSSPWNTGASTTISTSVTTDTEYIITFEYNGSAAGTGTVTAYLNGQSFGNFGSVGQLADHSDQIGLGDFNSQSIVTTPAECPVTTVVSSSGVVNPNNIIGAVNGTFAEINTNGNIITVDFGEEYPAGTEYEITWRRRPGSSGTAIMVLRESTSSGSGFVDHPSPPQVSDANTRTDVVTANSAFRYIQITKTDPPSVVDFHLDAIVVDCTTEDITFDQGDAASFYGSIPEFIYCSEPGSFSTAGRNKIESYLAIKYGITLDQSTAINYVNSNGDIIFNTATNASIGGYLEYNNDIAGIGRDDDSELDQSKSKSENTDAVVTIDRGSTISVDDTWLIWGNDNGALSESGSLTQPDTIDRRLERVWRVAERNEVLTTSVSFDITGLGLSTNENDFSLLIAGNSSNADFSNATVLTGGTLVGNVITFTGVDLENGQYFTLGTDFRVCSPGGIETNLALWLQATDKVYNTGTTLATDGQTVSGWGDSSTGGNDAADGSNLTTFETNTVNFNPAISFDNDATSLEGSLTTTNAGLTIFTAGFINSTSGNDDALLELRGGTSDDRSFFINSRYGGATAYSSNLNEDSWNIWSIDHPSGNTANIFQNGASFESSYNTTASDAGQGAYNYTLGDDDDAGNDFVGFLGEVIVYEGTLAPTDRQKIQSYLAIKYGITIDQSSATDYLASDGGTIWEAATNATYNNDIAGIGRDDMSCLEQKQSVSQNSDAIVTMGLGNIAADNASNANNFSADDSFLIWGNDDSNPNQANALSNVSQLPGNVTERMQRVWKVDETGTVGATTIEFDLTGLGYSSNVSDFQLIISDTNVGGDFSGASTIPAASLVGDKLTFTNVDLTDGQFFTLGTARTQCGPGGITSDLYVWLRADAGTSTTTDNTTISTWSDQSGTSTNAVADGNPPLFKSNTTDNINFNPTIDFEGGGDRLSLGNLANIKSGAANGGDYTLLAAGLRQSGSGVQYVLGSEGGTGNQDLHFGFRSSTQATIAHWGNDLDATVNAFDSPQAPYIVFAEYDGTGRIIEEIRGGAIGRATDGNTTDISGTKTNYVGDLASVGSYTGLISEVIVFDNDITEVQKQQVYTYMALKYGITLTNNNDNDGNVGEVISGSITEGDYVTSDGTTIVWDYSNNVAYHNDVAGIGRDDNSCWQQKQSRAEDTDDILTIGLGSIASSNGENANIFTDDRDYLIWGNDNGATANASVNTGDVPETIAERMARVWKVQDSGTVGETELQFDLTGLGYDVSDPNAFSLLVGNTATMADANIVTGGTLNGNILSFTGIDLNDGQFFTIGTQNVTCGPGGVNTDIAIWLRADLGTNTTIDNENITTWTDQSSPANSATEQNAGGGSPVEPTYQANEINFNPTIRFSDAQSTNNSWLETSSNTSDNDLTLISVFKTAQTNGSGTNFTDSPALISNESTSGSDDYALGLAEGRLYVNAENDNGYSIRPATTYVDEVPRIATATRIDANQANGINLYVNSENVGSATSDDVNLDAGGTITIGNHTDYDADGQFEGDIAEVLVFNKVLTAVERARVESYLAIKYGITRTVSGLTESDEDYLAADGGIIWNIDTQGNYHNDIFGIGRDDLSCFEQLKSKSINSDAIVTFELDSTAFKDNDTFILSGNDNAPMEAIDNSERPVGINSRLNREWRVQETGTVDTVLLTYDLTAITGTPIGDNNLNLVRLMVDDDGNFSSGATLISPSSIDGRTVTFEVDFTDGQFYTLGSIETDALPITLISFTANHHNDNEVKLEWVTASEINNEFYTIERSRDGQSFETIGIIDGAGNSDELLTYRFIDRNPLTGLSFYRLKQTDFNGEFDHSEIKSIRVESRFETEFKAYPNPIVRGQTLKIRYRVDGDQKLRIMVLNPRGQLLNQEERSASTSGELEISTSKFQKGLNLIRILDETQKVVTLKVLVR